jgi:hypothetical protein
LDFEWINHPDTFRHLTALSILQVFTGEEPAKQVWRSTGLRNRRAVLILAKRWEARPRRMRAASGGGIQKPTMRVRRDSGEAAAGLLTQEQAAVATG